MKKRTLSILLIIPFIISLLTFASIKILDNQVAVDILGISWGYNDYEGFQINEYGYKLEATPIIDQNLILSQGNVLVWSTNKINKDDDEFAKITYENGNYYLYALKEGEIEIICSNVKGTKSKHFIANIFKDGAMIINPTRRSSNSNISSTKYYGLYDYSNGNKVNSSFELTTTAYLNNGDISYKNNLVNCSSNISYKNGVVSILYPGESYVTLEEPNKHYRSTYKFSVIDGVNIYSYNDLLLATNKSNQGDTAVLQVNLDSLKNTYKVDSNGNYINEKLDETKDNTELFGNYDFKKQTFNFDNEYYTFPTTYDSTYIDQYNKEMNANISKEVIAGIHLKKSLYGNGFTINMNGLCYPNHGKIDKYTGKLTPTHKDENNPNILYDYFFGPLPYVSIGDMESFPLVTALGQDNSGIYIDNDNVTIDDVKIYNVDEVSNLYNLTYTGSIIDVKGKNVTISNSVIANGKVCIRGYDSNNLLIDNCILKNSGEFSLLLGSDQIDHYNTSRRVEEYGISKSFEEFFDDLSESDDTANGILNSFLDATMKGTLKEDDYQTKLELIQNYLDNDKSGLGYNANVIVNNTFFGRSGVFSIAFESMFNGPLLYGNIPTMLTSLLSKYLNSPLPNKIGGTSRPIHLTLKGDTRFYDWKDISTIDVSSLIEENISRTLNQMGYGDKNVTIDDIFPMKEVLLKESNKKGLVYKKNNTNYLNTMIAYYGGGMNNSSISIEVDNNSFNTYSNEISASLLEETIETNKGGGISSLFVDCVIVTIGTHPFRFITNGSSESISPLLIEQSPSIEELKAHLKEATK